MTPTNTPPPVSPGQAAPGVVSEADRRLVQVLIDWKNDPLFCAQLIANHVEAEINKRGRPTHEKWHEVLRELDNLRPALTAEQALRVKVEAELAEVKAELAQFSIRCPKCNGTTRHQKKKFVAICQTCKNRAQRERNDWKRANGIPLNPPKPGNGYDQRPEIKARAKQRRKERYGPGGSHHHQHLARMETRKAIRRGLLERQPCEKCGNPKSQMHHEDYSDPMKIKWLCAKCHRHHHFLDLRSKLT